MAMIKISNEHTKFVFSVEKYNPDKKREYAKLHMGVHNGFVNFELTINSLQNYELEELVMFLKYTLEGAFIQRNYKIDLFDSKTREEDTFYCENFEFHANCCKYNKNLSYINVIIYLPLLSKSGVEMWCGVIEYDGIKKLYDDILEEMDLCTHSNMLDVIITKEIENDGSQEVLCAKASYNDPYEKQYTFLVDEIKEDVCWYVEGTRAEVYVSEFFYCRIDELPVPYSKMKKLEWE